MPIQRTRPRPDVFETIESLRFENRTVHLANRQMECRQMQLQRALWVLFAALLVAGFALAGNWLGLPASCVAGLP